MIFPSGLLENTDCLSCILTGQSMGAGPCNLPTSCFSTSDPCSALHPSCAAEQFQQVRFDHGSLVWGKSRCSSPVVQEGRWCHTMVGNQPCIIHNPEDGAVAGDRSVCAQGHQQCSKGKVCCSRFSLYLLAGRFSPLLMLEMLCYG